MQKQHPNTFELEKLEIHKLQRRTWMVQPLISSRQRLVFWFDFFRSGLDALSWRL